MYNSKNADCNQSLLMMNSTNRMLKALHHLLRNKYCTFKEIFKCLSYDNKNLKWDHIHVDSSCRVL